MEIIRNMIKRMIYVVLRVSSIIKIEKKLNKRKKKKEERRYSTCNNYQLIC